MRLQLSTSLAGALLATGALAGGGEDCANAELLAPGPSTNAFDTTIALDEGVLPSCGGAGAMLDTWFEWTPNVSSDWVFSTCNAASYDSRLALWDGCAGAELGCNDDGAGCAGFSSEMTVVGLTAGTSYFIQVGGFNAAEVGTGTLDIFEFVPPAPVLNVANGNHYMAISAPNITWEDAQAAAQANIFMGVPGHLASLTDAAEDAFVFALGDVHYHWIGGFQDTMDPLYMEPDIGWKWSTGEPFGYMNWYAPEPNNDPAPEDHMELLQGGQFGETWNDAQNGIHSRGYIIEWETSGAGANFCTSAPNSVTPMGGATGSIISNTGSTSVSANDLVLTAGPMVVGEPGIFFYGTSELNGGMGLPFGNGFRCAGGTVVRFFPPVQANASGDMVLAVDNSLPGIAGSSAPIIDMATLHFQSWYRDPAGGGAGFNLSDGLTLTFTP